MDQVVTGEKPLKVDRAGTVWIVLALAAVAFVGIFAVVPLTHAQYSPQDIAIKLTAMAVAVLIALGTVWLYFNQCATIWPDRVDYANGFGSTRSLRRSGIKGFRHTSKNAKITLIPRDEFGKPIEVSAGLLKDVRTKAWFEGLPDLDAQDLAAAQKELEGDPRLGATDMERRLAIAKIKFAAQIVNGAGLVFGFWAFLTAWPSNAPVYGAIAAMSGAFALKLVYGSLVTFGSGRSDARPSVAMVLFCGLAVGARGVIDNHVLDWTTALELAAGIALAVSLILMAQDELMRLNLSQVPFVVLAFVGFFYGAIVTANRVLDSTQPTVFRTWVDEKHVITGKSTSYDITLDNWGDQRAGMEVSVSRHFYDSVQLSDVVCVDLSKGAFGFRYFTVNHCAA